MLLIKSKCCKSLEEIKEELDKDILRINKILHSCESTDNLELRCKQTENIYNWATYLIKNKILFYSSKCKDYNKELLQYYTDFVLRLWSSIELINNFSNITKFPV